jgi:DNA gyrase subunit A
MGIVASELRKVKDRFADARRTEMQVDEGSEFALEDLVPDEDMVIAVSATGYIKRTRLDEYRLQRRGGGGASGMQVREEDAVSQLFVASTHSYMLIFSDRGRVYWLKVHRIPEAGRSGKGKHISNLVALEPGERVASLVSVREWPKTEGDAYIVLGTRKGVIKKTDLVAFSNPRQAGIIAVGVDEDDAVIDVQTSTGKDEILLATRHGMAIRFSEEEVRPMGRTAYGVRGIGLREGDHVVSMAVVHSTDGFILSVTENGYGKRTPLDEYRVQSRGGLGIINIQTSDRNGAVVGVLFVTEDDQLMLMTQQGKILRTRVTDTRPIGRNTQGVRLIRIDEADKVVSVARFAEKDEDGGAPADEDLGITPPAGETDTPVD